jgi:hypothetical protein
MTYSYLDSFQRSITNLSAMILIFQYQGTKLQFEIWPMFQSFLYLFVMIEIWSMSPSFPYLLASIRFIGTASQIFLLLFLLSNILAPSQKTCQGTISNFAKYCEVICMCKLPPRSQHLPMYVLIQTKFTLPTMINTQRSRPKYVYKKICYCRISQGVRTPRCIHHLVVEYLV